MVALNGKIVSQGSQFSLKDVEVVTATLDIEDVRAHRTQASRGVQAAHAEKYPRIEVDFALSSSDPQLALELTSTKGFEVRYHSPYEEIA